MNRPATTSVYNPLALPKKSVWSIIGTDNIWRGILIHVALGLSGLFLKYFFILWFYFLLFNFLTLNQRQKLAVIPILLAYLIPAELFGRMINGSPLMPWETAKYLGMLLLIFGISINKKKSRGKSGLRILLLSLPALLIGMSLSERLVRDITFNYLGIFNLALAVIFFANYPLSNKKVVEIFRAILLGSITVLAYVFFRTPNLAAVEFELGANFDVTGGFGSNQVASVLGLAFGIGAFLWINQIKLFKNEAFNLALPGIFLIWSLLSFSRGGVLSAVAALVLIVLMVPKKKQTFAPRKINPKLIGAIIVLIPGIFYYANKLTGGQLLKRYSGETYGTIYADKAKDLSQLTSGRWDIFLSDVDMWLDNFVFGVGVGQSAVLRPLYGYGREAAHVEVSRLLSEHGLMGLIISIIFIFSPVVLFFKAKRPFHKAMLIFCFTIALITSMHSAMRTFITPFFYGLGFAFYIPDFSMNRTKRLKRKEVFLPNEY